MTIGKVRYRVRVVKDAQRHRARYAKVDSPDALHGYISPARREIVIEEGSPEQMATTGWYAGLAGDHPDDGRLLARQECFGAGNENETASRSKPS